MFITQESHREAFPVRDKGLFIAALNSLPDRVKSCEVCVVDMVRKTLQKHFCMLFLRVDSYHAYNLCETFYDDEI